MVKRVTILVKILTTDNTRPNRKLAITAIQTIVCSQAIVK